MDNCLFCKIAKHDIPSYTVYEDDECIAFLDLSQTTYGHTLVVSKEHYENALAANDATMSHMMCVAKELGNTMKQQLGAKGINILTNAGEAAGQTVMHFHIHVIPRYDENDGYNPEFVSHEDEYDLEALAEKLKAR